MPALTVYKLRSQVEGQQVQDFESYIEQERSLDRYGPVEGPGFEAALYVMTSPPNPPRWAGFLRSGFGEGVTIPMRKSVGALVLVRIIIENENEYFALPFGQTGRFILDESAIERAYGLRAALNLIYPRQIQESEAARLIAIDSKRHEKDVMRARVQSSRAATFETFDVDRLRDVLDAATGRPADTERWGRRMTGADALSFGTEIEFAELGAMCRRVHAAHRRTDYRMRFAWLDNIKPVADPSTVAQLEAEIIVRLQSAAVDDLELAPPEIVSWEKVDDFRYGVEASRRIRHQDLRVHELIAALRHARYLDDLTPAFLRRTHVSALDSTGERVHRWSVWKCITGTIQLGGTTYVLDEGQFFSIAGDFLEQVDAFVDGLEKGDAVLPIFRYGWDEETYNQTACSSEPGWLLMDRRTITSSEATTAIEVCDILTQGRQLIHVKRELGSRDLSHLFSQGAVSAELIQIDPQFCSAVQDKVRDLSGGSQFGFFDPFPIATADFQVTFAVVANWRGRSPAQALPFFAKINLRRTAGNLQNRGFRVAFQPIDIEHQRKTP